MLDLTQARIFALTVHFVGNKAQGEDYVASRKLTDMDDRLEDVLVKYFLKPFKTDEAYRFTHPTTLQLNEVYTYVKGIFDDKSTLLPQSVNILKHLYHAGTHPQIRSGELYVAYMGNCLLDEEPLDCIGIFKSEQKDTFLRLRRESDGMELEPEEGINVRKLDKGCLVFKTEEDEGFRVMTIDASGNDTVYWMDDFLQVVNEKNEYFYTRNAMAMCRNFSEHVVAAMQDKKEQAIFLKQSVEYFSKNESFDMNTFADEVLGEENPYNEVFKNYQPIYENASGKEIEPSFAISKPAVIKEKKHFKGILKLDTNMDIHLNFDNLENGRHFIEKGWDEERGMYFYKVYFNKEV